MLKPPKIVITNIDEDPDVRKDRRRKAIVEICGKFLPKSLLGTMRPTELLVGLHSASDR